MNTDQTRIDERAALRLLDEHFLRSAPITVEIGPSAMFALIGTLQLALRHPGNRGPTAELMTGFKDDMIARLAGGNDEIEALLRLGDDPRYDA